MSVCTINELVARIPFWDSREKIASSCFILTYTRPWHYQQPAISVVYTYDFRMRHKHQTVCARCQHTRICIWTHNGTIELVCLYGGTSSRNRTCLCVHECMNVTVLVGDGSVASSKDACHINHALNSLLSLSHTHRVDACVCVCVCVRWTNTRTQTESITPVILLKFNESPLLSRWVFFSVKNSPNSN